MTPGRPVIALRALRDERRLSRPRLAELSGVPASSIESYERGQSTPSVIAAKRLADAMGVSLDDFFVADAAGAAA